SQTFLFDVTGPDYTNNGVGVTVDAGKTSGSTTITGLEPTTGNDKYTVHEEAPGSPWTAASDQSTAIPASACSAEVTMANTFAPAVAKAAKVTVPAGSSGPWHMTLHGDDSSTDQTIDVTAGAGLQSFSKSLVDGVTYTISEDASSVA